MEKALEGEAASHLGYAKYERSPGINNRNGKFGKTVKTEKDPNTIDTPHDRDSSFEPRFVQKRQHRSGILDQQIIVLYSKGITTREIAAMIKEMYDVDISPTLVRHITESVITASGSSTNPYCFGYQPPGQEKTSEAFAC